MSVWVKISTYLGGAGDDAANAIAVDSLGNAYVTGFTLSPDFPTVNAYQGSHAGGYYNVFIAKLGPLGDTLVYSTYLGGSGDDAANAIAVDSLGNAYVTGFTLSPDFPTVSAYQGSHAGSSYDAFIAKLGSSGNTLVYSTYLGGSGDDLSYTIAVDSSGNAYVSGVTVSTNFPTVNAYQVSHAGGITDAFVTKLGPSGNTLAYSTYLGGSDWDLGNAIAVDSSGNAYVAGVTVSTNFPTANAYQATQGRAGWSDAFVTKLGPSGNALVYSTYLGGTRDDDAYAIAVDSSGSAYVAGYTFSPDFPTANAYQGVQGGNGWADAFITKLGPSGDTLSYSTFLGGGGSEFAYAIAIDSSGNAYVAGRTDGSTFPTLNGHQGSYQGGGSDAFVAKLAPLGNTLSYSTFLGGLNDEWANAIAVDSSGNAYVAGPTSSVNFPTANAYRVSKNGCYDAFITKFAFGSPFYPFFPGDGLYNYESAWTFLTKTQPQSMTPAGRDVYLSFAGDGLYKYNGSLKRITTAQPQTAVAAGSVMYLHFLGDGVYKFNGSWTKITSAEPQVMVASGSSVYLYFSGDGLYKYNGSSWTLLTRASPASIVASNEGFYAYFTSDGLYRYDGTWNAGTFNKGKWTKITSAQPSSMFVAGPYLYAYFPGDGLYKYNTLRLVFLTRTQPARIVASVKGFYAYFASDGLYEYDGTWNAAISNDGKWTKITSAEPSNMAVSGKVLYPYFTGDGLYRYDDGSWTFLTRTEPSNMTGLGAN